MRVSSRSTTVREQARAAAVWRSTLLCHAPLLYPSEATRKPLGDIPIEELLIGVNEVKALEKLKLFYVERNQGLGLLLHRTQVASVEPGEPIELGVHVRGYETRLRLELEFVRCEVVELV